MARFVDVVAAILGLVLVTPTIRVIALAVRMSSPGPVIARTRKRRDDGTTICIYKFRTTRGDSSQTTDLGRFLRQSSLEELPTLINVMRGDITLADYIDNSYG